MQQPPGFHHPNTSLVCRLNKAIYGLKQDPRAWFERLGKALQRFGFIASKVDPFLFIRKINQSITYVLVYVDDILITSNDSNFISLLKFQLNQEFALKDLGLLKFFLGIEVKYTPDGCMVLSQKRYIQNLLIKAKLDKAKAIRTPMISGLKLTKEGHNYMSDPFLYRSIVGALRYATITRHEIAFSVNKVCQYMQQPLDEHWTAVKRILRYLNGTLSFGLKFSPSSTLNMTVFCDSDMGNDMDDHRSTLGFCIFLGNNLVSWTAKKQPVVARSTTEAEYRSLALATMEVLWLQTLLTELRFPLRIKPLVYCDNLNTVLLTRNPILHNRTKHLELDLYFVREKVLANQIIVSHVPTLYQRADIFTKPLSFSRFSFLRDKLRVGHPL